MSFSKHRPSQLLGGKTASVATAEALELPRPAVRRWSLGTPALLVSALVFAALSAYVAGRVDFGSVQTPEASRTPALAPSFASPPQATALPDTVASPVAHLPVFIGTTATASVHQEGLASVGPTPRLIEVAVVREKGPVEKNAVLVIPYAPTAAGKKAMTSDLEKTEEALSKPTVGLDTDPDTAAVEKMALLAMDIVETKLSGVRRVVVARLVGRTAVELFATRVERQAWVVLVAIENHFEGYHTSKAGAVGIAQLIPGYAKDFAGECGLAGITEADLHDDATNLMLSACYFKSLITRFKGFVPLALVGYNAGQYSSDVRMYANLGSMTSEPSTYIQRFTIVNFGIDHAEMIPDLKSLASDLRKTVNSKKVKGKSSGQVAPNMALIRSPAMFELASMLNLEITSHY